MADDPSAFDYLPATLSYPSLVAASKDCRGCELYKNATQTVFGEGDLASGIVFVGEQPGDEEDIKGHPFVGPAGRLLDKALADAGIDRQRIYLTNAVKHFKWKPQGKRRLHERPKASEIAACDPWLRAELMLTEVKLLVCLGATAAQIGLRPILLRWRWLRSTLRRSCERRPTCARMSTAISSPIYRWLPLRSTASELPAYKQ